MKKAILFAIFLISIGKALAIPFGAGLGNNGLSSFLIPKMLIILAAIGIPTASYLIYQHFSNYGWNDAFKKGSIITAIAAYVPNFTWINSLSWYKSIIMNQFRTIHYGNGFYSMIRYGRDMVNVADDLSINQIFSRLPGLNHVNVEFFKFDKTEMFLKGQLRGAPNVAGKIKSLYNFHLWGDDLVTSLANPLRARILSDELYGLAIKVSKGQITKAEANVIANEIAKGIGSQNLLKLGIKNTFKNTIRGAAVAVPIIAGIDIIDEILNNKPSKEVAYNIGLDSTNAIISIGAGAAVGTAAVALGLASNPVGWAITAGIGISLLLQYTGADKIVFDFIKDATPQPIKDFAIWTTGKAIEGVSWIGMELSKDPSKILYATPAAHLKFILDNKQAISDVGKIAADALVNSANEIGNAIKDIGKKVVNSVEGAINGFKG